LEQWLQKTAIERETLKIPLPLKKCAIIEQSQRL
jgi:hypothetical protein